MHFFMGLALRESLEETTKYFMGKTMVSFLFPADFSLGQFYDFYTCQIKARYEVVICLVVWNIFYFPIYWD